MSKDKSTDGGTPVLQTDKLTKRFGGLTAVDGVSIAIEPGDIVAMIGPNGSGKSTFLNTVMGLYEPDRGDVLFQGDRITGMRPHARAKSGLIKSEQNPNLFSEMTVTECLLLAYQQFDGRSGISRLLPHPDGNRKKVEEVISFLDLDQLADEDVDSLSGGQRKLLDFGMSIISDPDLLLLDEPTAGVNPTLINELVDRIRELNKRGITFLVVEHNMDVVMNLADSVIVLDEGQVLIRDEPEAVQESEAVIDAYFGTGKIEP